jgi:large subunit ribosomal protein L11
MGDIIPADITIFTDGSYKFTLRTQPAAILLKKAAGIPKGAAEPNKEVVGEITRDQLREIAQTKMRDLNAVDIEGAMRQIEGTAKQMGIKIKD